MFVFQYDGLFQRIYPGEKYPDKRLCDTNLGTIISNSRDYLGREVIVVFDNNKNKTYSVGEDLVLSTLRQGILKCVSRSSDVKRSIITFEDTPLIIPTYSMIDMVPLQALAYPVSADDPEVSRFFFTFFYHRRGEGGVMHSNPLGAFVDGRSKVLRPKSDCNQAFFSRLQSMSEKLEYGYGVPEKSSREYEKLAMQEDSIVNKTYVIRCGRRNA